MENLFKNIKKNYINLTVVRSAKGNFFGFIEPLKNDDFFMPGSVKQILNVATQR